MKNKLNGNEEIYTKVSNKNEIKILFAPLRIARGRVN
jgi:hypothetical protein